MTAAPKTTVFFEAVRTQHDIENCSGGRAKRAHRAPQQRGWHAINGARRPHTSIAISASTC